jgi:amino acid transporter
LKLKTADLIVYGLVLIQPIAPVGIFGIANVLSQGHVTSSILLAMVAMMFTALSYGRLAARSILLRAPPIRTCPALSILLPVT